MFHSMIATRNKMTGVKFISPEQAAAIVSDDSTVGLVGGGGG